MNERTAQLIEALAAKLGTTSEYLWGVLVKQAPISAATNAVLLSVFLSLAALASVRVAKHARASKKNNPYADDVMWWIFLVMLWFAAVCAVAGSASGIISGFFNPEYWALKQLMSGCHE